jgi:hypothetical protein
MNRSFPTRFALTLALMTLIGCSLPPAEDTNIIACRDLARIERSSTATLTEQTEAKLDSRAIGCPRIL